MRMLFSILAIASLCQVAIAADEHSPIELTVEARAIEMPTLKYRLFPAESELKTGDAAPILLRLPWEQTIWMSKVFLTLHEWNSRPLTAPEWENSGGVLPSSFYSEMKRAAFRRDALWEYPLNETASPYFILLPDVQGLRGFLGNGLSAKIRYHLTKGELDQAREGILVGLANARHLARTPFYINQLVAAAIHRTMLERTEELIAQPHSPNLYWALSTLPDSLLELHRAASFESRAFAMTLPAAEDLNQPRDAAEWSKMAAQLVELLEQLQEIPKMERPKADRSVVEQFLERINPPKNGPLVEMLKQARAELPKLANIEDRRVADMSDDEAVVRWYVLRRLARDEFTSAVMMLPPQEAWSQFPALLKEIEEFQKITHARAIDPLRPETIYFTLWSIKRRINAVRIIEAARHYAATHDGQWPKTLNDMNDVSLPVDPLTSQPFQWTVEGPAAKLIAPRLPELLFQRTQEGAEKKSSAENHQLEYHVQLRK